MTAEAADYLSDLQFTGAYRVPFPYSAYLREHIAVAVRPVRFPGLPTAMMVTAPA